MPTIVHLSDVHLFADPDAQEAIFDSLVASLAALRADLFARGARADLLAITGDVFNSSTVDPVQAVSAYAGVFDRVDAALGGAVPTIVLPGNHDRRALGVLGPHSPRLFNALRDAMAPRANVYVHGCDSPSLAALIPAERHGLPAHVIAYDTTFLPTGLLSAGGAVRQEDLLQLADQIDEAGGALPVVVLMHHHLIPTPLTDVSEIDAHGKPWYIRWPLRHIVPAILANAEREELTMTALGSGTALSTLHGFGRAVLILHGHKHYPTVRMLRAMAPAQGDVLLTSAGSAGTAERWYSGSHDDARLWPSFNVLSLDDGTLDVSTVSFPDRGRGIPRHRTLARAALEGRHWRVLETPEAAAPAPSPDVPFELNEMRVEISTGADRGRARWDLTVTRTLRRSRGGVQGDYTEMADGVSGCVVELMDESGSPRIRHAPTRVSLRADGVTRYKLSSGASRTVDDGGVLRGHGTAFESVALLDRYGARTTRLVLESPAGAIGRPFASRTDLGTGIEQPARLARAAEGTTFTLEVTDCPPRTMLKIYWPLDR